MVGSSLSICVVRGWHPWRSFVRATELYMNPEILIATNGFKDSWAAIEYGAWLAQLMHVKVTLLGVSEIRGDSSEPMETI